MKKLITMVYAAALLLGYTKINAQVINTTHVATPANEYVGWDGTGTTKDLDLTNIFVGKNINFTTTTTGPTTTQKATILANGNVGINLAAPQNKLHIDAGSLQITNSGTGGTGSGTGDGLLIGQTSPTGFNVDINNQSNGAMKFFTNNVIRMFIENGGGSGYVGIGGGFQAPVSRLHLKEGSDDGWFQVTTTSTSSTATDGLRIGVINSSGNVEIKQQETADMLFHTSNSERMRILSGGNVGIGINAPASILHTVASGLKNANYTGVTLSNTATSITPNINKYGVQITSSSGWTGSGCINYGLDVFATGASGGINVGLNVDVDPGGVTGYSGLFSGGNVGINTTTPDYRLEVLDNTLAIGASVTGANSVNTAGTFTANTATNNFGVRCTTSTGGSPVTNAAGSFYADGGSSANYGIHADAFGTGGSAFNYGGHFDSRNGLNNRAVYGAAKSTATNNYGGYFEALNGANNNYGVYASGGNANCANGAGMCPDAAGFFSGDVYTTSGYFASDGFLKDNISDLTDASSILSLLSPKTYTFKTQDYPSMHLSDKNQYGLIADDVMQILPELVRSFNEPEVTDDQGNTVYAEVNFKALNYNQLIPILIAGYQEQQAQINAMQTQIDGCCNQRYSNTINDNTGSIELENLEGLQLLQNDPNPFSESTMIKWNLPDEFQNAVLYFYDNSGSQINSYKVNAKGAGELQIFGSKLSSGVYTYTLVVDGKVTDSKKMVKTSK